MEGRVGPAIARPFLVDPVELRDPLENSKRLDFACIYDVFRPLNERNYCLLALQSNSEHCS